MGEYSIVRRKRGPSAEKTTIVYFYYYCVLYDFQKQTYCQTKKNEKRNGQRARQRPSERWMLTTKEEGRLTGMEEAEGLAEAALGVQLRDALRLPERLKERGDRERLGETALREGLGKALWLPERLGNTGLGVRLGEVL